MKFMNNRIGILTFQRAHNYGAILQVYSLQEFLKSYSYNVEVIDYNPEALQYYHYSKNYTLSLLHPIGSVKTLLYYQRRKKRYYAFNSFIEKNLNLSHCDLSSLSDYFDSIVIGSDQVWNLKNSLGKYDYFYWGQFKHNEKPHLISYAASMGSSENVDWLRISNLLKNFNSISVRENYLQKAIRKNCCINAEWTLDPTLLQNRAFFENIAIDPQIKEPYLFFYQARSNKQAYLYAKKWAKKMNLKFVCLSAHIMLQNNSIVVQAGPLEFLGLIKNAQYVITSSFHGTVFCYHFKKKFTTLRLNDRDNGRCESLLQLLGLGNKMVSLTDSPNVGNTDWSLADKQLEEARSFSRNWLINHLF